MSYNYAIIGAGMQGTAAAYDIARFSGAKEVILGDIALEQAKKAQRKVNKLLGRKIVKATQINVRDRAALVEFLRGIDCALSAVPHYFNLGIAQAAIEAKASMCDLGGNTEIVLEELKLDAEAKKAGVTIIPDCGLMPGMGNTLAVYGMSKMDRCDEVRIRCGGLPQKPKPPLSYTLAFNIEGLTNEYLEQAYILREGKVTQVDPLTELEEIVFPSPIGKCEAAITSGGTSTCPWTFEGQVKEYDDKSVRYPGHYEKIKAMMELGLLSSEPVEVDGVKVAPRELFHKVVAPKISFPNDPDVVVLRVICRGVKDGQPMEVQLDIKDFYDKGTGLTAMERTTAFPASIVAIMIGKGETGKGAIPLERAIPGDRFVAELPKRGIKLVEMVEVIREH